MIVVNMKVLILLRLKIFPFILFLKSWWISEGLNQIHKSKTEIIANEAMALEETLNIIFV